MAIPKKEIVDVRMSRRISAFIEHPGNHSYCWVVNRDGTHTCSNRTGDLSGDIIVPAFTLQELMHMMAEDFPLIRTGESNKREDVLWYAANANIESKGYKYPLKAVAKLLLEGLEKEIYKVRYYDVSGSSKLFPMIKIKK
jgi:hypothetical protein